jgi:hypothetical protein
VHPAANLIPPLTDAEFKDLCADIEKNGLQVPVVLFVESNGDESLLDGRHRLDAMQLLSDESKDQSTRLVVSRRPDLRLYFERNNTVGAVPVRRVRNVDPYAYVISANLHRRHLTPEKRQNLIIEIIAKNPEKSDRQHGNELGVDHKVISRARAKGEDVGRVPHVEKRTDTKGRQQPASRPPRPSPHKFKKGGEPVNWVVDAAKRQVTEVPKPAEPAKPPVTGEAIPAFLRRTPEPAPATGESKPITLERFLLVDPDREWSLIPNYFAEALALTIERMPSIERRGFLANLRKIIDRQESFISAWEEKTARGKGGAA